MDERRRRFEAQIMPHLDAANNLARWLARDRDLADDIVQDAMLRAFRAFDRIRGDDAKPWLLQIVRNCHRTALAQRKRRGHVPLPEEGDGSMMEMSADDPNPEAMAVSAGESRKLEAAIAALPEEFRETLVLRELEELSYREIADAVGIPIGTVMSRLARARAMLREKWQSGDGMH
jgi:RNA polymerase sigma-70 factor (ECF subfamily)